VLFVSWLWFFLCILPVYLGAPYAFSNKSFLTYQKNKNKNWHTICSSKVSGGLGVRNMVLFNRALMGKWFLRYALERDALWRKVVDFKYESMKGDWCSKEVGGSFEVGVWKCIRRGWDAFAAHVRYEIENGSKVLFWHDVWCGEIPLKTLFPELFLIASGKDAWVEENMQRQNSTIL
jgi:hypothetical protein